MGILEDNCLNIRIAEETGTARTARGRRNGLPWLLVGGGLLAIVCVVVGMKMLSRGNLEEKPNVVSEPLPKTIDEPWQEAADQATEDSTVADDGKTLWVSPTEGEPLELGYLLPGTQLVLHVRVADLLAHAEGDKVLAALGPWCQQVVKQLTSSTGVELAEINTLLLGIRPTQSGPLQFALRVQLKNALPLTDAPDQNSWFAPSRENGKVVVACSEAALAELVAEQGSPPLFPRELQRVLQRTDSQRMATLVFAGKFWQISGEKFLQGTGEPLRNAIVDFLGDEATATMLSAHWDDHCFLELQSTVALNERPHRFAALLEQRLAASSDQVEDVIFG